MKDAIIRQTRSNLVQSRLFSELLEETIRKYQNRTIEVAQSAVMELGDEALKAIARDLVKAVRNSVTIDWTRKDSVKVKIRTMVKRILRKYDYPPDKQEKATRTVLEQAELLCGDWAEEKVA